MENQLDLLPMPAAKVGRPATIASPNMEVVKELVAAGVPYEQIAKRFNVSRDLIYTWVSRYNWITPTKIERKVRELNSLDSKAQLVTSDKLAMSGNLQAEGMSALDIAVESARKTGLASLAGFVQRAAPVFDKFTPDVPETIGEASILLKMVKSAAGLDSSQGQQTNVQVNIATGPWGGKTQSHRDTDTEDD